MKRLICGVFAIVAGVGAQVQPGRHLNSNRLWIRDFRAVNAPWQPIGRAQRLIAMAAWDGRLYGASVAWYLLEREASVRDTPWTILHESFMISAIAVLNGKLYVANQLDALWVGPIASKMRFQLIGSAKRVTAMAALNGNIYAINMDGRLLAWEDAAHKPVRWVDIGPAARVTALTAMGEKLYAATSGNQLLTRGGALQDEPWKLIGHAENVTAMAAFDGKIYAAAYSPSVTANPRSLATCALWESNQSYWETRSLLGVAKRVGRIKDRQDCPKMANDPAALREWPSGRGLADLIAGSCAQCVCAAEF